MIDYSKKSGPEWANEVIKATKIGRWRRDRGWRLKNRFERRWWNEDDDVREVYGLFVFPWRYARRIWPDGFEPERPSLTNVIKNKEF